MDEFKSGMEFDGYRLTKEIGQGGMGTVFLAEDTLLERPVAIKFITADADEEARERFAVEARAIARLQHPNVVAVHRVGEWNRVPYLVSEYVPGEALNRIRVPVPWRRALAIGTGLAGALALAHRRGVLHRDIKPANVILSEDGETKLLDFGIAKLLEGRPSTSEQDHGQQAPEPTPTGQTSVALDPDSTAAVTVHEGLLNPGNVQLTRPGIVMGTPAYLPPEIWLGRSATFQSDIYSLGALLFYLCAGRAPFTEDTIEGLAAAVTDRSAPELEQTASNVNSGFAAVVNRCLARDPDDRYDNGEALRLALARIALGKSTDMLPDGNPYRGLATFNQEHRNLFFGRDSEIRMILERFSTEAFVLVVGDSGVGKSSLIRAGILPRFDEWVDRKRSWTTISIVPGPHPVATLSSSLADLLEADEKEVAALLHEDPTELGRRIRLAHGPTRGTVLFIDQLEELLTLADRSDAEVFAEVIHWLTIPTPGLRVVATIRGDFLGRLANLGPLGENLSRKIYFLRPLSEERIRDAILSPARAKGVRFESEALVEGLVASTAGSEAGALPLLQFALTRLWEAPREDPNVIPRKALEDLGGVEGALARHADEVIAGLRPNGQQAARQILVALVNSDGTRARVSEKELKTQIDSAGAALDSLVRGRILSVGENDGEPTFSIAHEVLISGWPTLEGWLSKTEDVRRARERIRTGSENWKRLGLGREGLFGKQQLKEMGDLSGQKLNLLEKRFVALSRRTLQRRTAYRIAFILALPVFAALIYGGMTTTAREKREKEVANVVLAAEKKLSTARDVGATTESTRATALEHFDNRDLEAGEAAWLVYREKVSLLQETLSESSQLLESALLLDPQRQETRLAQAEALYRWALEAESSGDNATADALVRRMKIYDVDGSRLKAWRAPGVVRITATPSSTKGRLVRMSANPDGRYESRSRGKISTNGEPLELEPGSYVASLEAAGHAQVQLPFRVDRGGKLNLDVKMLPLKQVPRGMEHIPGGVFLFGSGAKDGQRRDFFHTVPIHSRKVESFLISRRETTFADWIEYLEALPEEQRTERLPRVEAGGFQGALGLRKLEGEGWEITLKPAGERLVAKTGEKVRFPGRDRRAEQDWLEFPVTGITASDAVDYATWLRSTGKVSGARLCTELEWEWAARGADGREFPHGDALGKDDANYDDTYDKNPKAMGPDQVGSHPASKSPFGVEDLAGNAWEWTVSVIEDGYVARGGSYYYGKNTSRTTERAITEPSFRDASVGTRICADPAR